MNNNKIKSINYNFIMNLIYTVSSAIFPLITFPYVSRVLLADGNGKAAFAIGVVSYFAMLASIGIPNYGIRATAQVRNNKKELSKVTQELIIINLVVTVFVYVIFIASLFLVPKFQDRKTVLLVASSLMWLNVIGVTWLYNGLEQYSYITKVSILFKIISMVLIFQFVKDKNDYIVYTAITVVSTAGSYLFNFINMRKYISFKKQSNFSFKRHFNPIFMFFGTTIVGCVATSLDTVMLGFMQNDSAVGYYNVAVKVKTVLISIVTSLGTVLLPRLSFYVTEGKQKEFLEIIKKSFNFIFLCATSVTVFFIMFSKDVILILSGKDFLGAVRPMQLLLPSVLLIGLSNITGLQILIPHGFEKKVFAAIGTGSLINLILNFFLIPQFSVNGAAVATVISDVIALSIEIFMLKDMLIPMFKSGYKNILKIFFSICVASVITFFFSKFLNVLFNPNHTAESNSDLFFRLMISFLIFGILYFLCLYLVKEKFLNETIIPFVKKILKKGLNLKNGKHKN